MEAMFDVDKDFLTTFDPSTDKVYESARLRWSLKAKRETLPIEASRVFHIPRIVLPSASYLIAAGSVILRLIHTIDHLVLIAR